MMLWQMTISVEVDRASRFHTPRRGPGSHRCGVAPLLPRSRARLMRRP